MDGDFYNRDPTESIMFELEKRNKMGDRRIAYYQGKHALVDIGIGVVGLIPGAALPCLMAAIASQGPVIYQPMARELQQIYLTPPEEMAHLQVNMLPDQLLLNAAFDIAGEFGVDFLKEMAWEIALEAGVGAFAGTLIPIIGGIVGAGWDWYIANKMTLRVGRMTALYFQRGGRWKNGNRKETTEEAKRMNGDLNSIYRENPEVRRTMLSKLAMTIKMVRQYMSADQIREMLRSQKVPDDLIDEALRTIN